MRPSARKKVSIFFFFSNKVLSSETMYVLTPGASAHLMDYV